MHVPHFTPKPLPPRPQPTVVPARFAPVYCANGDGRRADIWASIDTPLCGRCFLESIGELSTTVS